jgi:hypothetical protein
MRGTRAHLLRIHPPLESGRVAVCALEGPRTTLGRDVDSSIVLDAPGVSLQHARVERSRLGGRLRVTDLESTNGTHVNGWRVPPEGADCEPGSLLRFGEALFVYRELTDEEAETASLPPLPGPLHTRNARLARAIQRIQGLLGGDKPIWLCGPSGSGRSILERHLRDLAGEFDGLLDDTEPRMTLHCSEEPPLEAVPERTVCFPPLRERMEDIPILIHALCAPRVPRFTPRMLAAMHLYDWPGNIRELRIMLERAYHPQWGSMPGAPWDLDSFPDIRHYLERRPPAQGGLLPRTEALTEPSRRRLPKEVGPQALRELLDEHRWKLFPTARAMGISRATLVRSLARVGIRGPSHGLTAGGASFVSLPSLPGVKR